MDEVLPRIEADIKEAESALVLGSSNVKNLLADRVDDAFLVIVAVLLVLFGHWI